MSNSGRLKSQTGMYHVIIKSHSHFNLFEKENDKIKFLRLLKYYQKKFQFSLYCYCLMDNHGHFLINEQNSNLSIIFREVNRMYSNYLHNRYSSYGPSFKNRFKSIPVESDSYLIQLSVYIHNNPRKILRFRNSPEKYQFSSLATYLNLKDDYFKILDTKKILKYFGNTDKMAIANYRQKMELDIT
ncbi:transposase [Clostridium sp. ATCC 25772]|uniref:transposase n=1 Tax=Clostridium sp. ATCC 25772 TaxID=1676991 RepID=UPI0007838077|nr:transposase [Clostridium sp. ATCC 25772]